MSRDVQLDDEIVLFTRVDATVEISGEVSINSISLKVGGSSVTVDPNHPLFQIMCEALGDGGFDTYAQDKAGLVYRGLGGNDPDGHYVWGDR